MSLTIREFTFNAFAENTYVVHDETKEGVIIDPGCESQEERKQLQKYVESLDLNIKYILNTHCHIDHVLGNSFAKSTFNGMLAIPEGEVAGLNSVPLYAPMYGVNNYEASEPDHLIKQNEVISFGKTKFKVLFVPGHSEGHVAFYHESEKVCFSGDVLFKESIGRTDLPGGNHETLEKSIKEVMYQLPPDTIIYCGHGETTTIHHEKQYNPFVR